MKIYLVGGAVRDKLLGRPVKEKDWVVVGATAQDMLQLGYRQVGKDFPVFLHPETAEEYALARKERKIGLGYTGFTFDTSSQVTLEEDLKRRDLTINAMAETSTGELVDPYHGQADLQEKILRHVSSAFVEDPVRILRVARFAARFYDFKVAEETNELMKQMVSSGEVDALVAERVWKEWERALTEKHPERFFEVLAECGALLKLFPELQLKSKGMQLLIQVVAVSNDPQIRFAALLHDLAEEKIKAICERFRVPSDYRDLALLTSKHLARWNNKISKLSPEEVVDILQEADAFRREERFKKMLVVCDAASIPVRSTLLLALLQAAKQIDVKTLSQGLVGKEIAARLYQARVAKIAEMLK